MDRGLFLDLDGTLADSLMVMRRVYERFLANFSCSATDHEFAALNGPPLQEVVQRLKDAHGLDGSIDDLLTTYRSFILKAYEDVHPSAGARALLECAREKGWTVGVVTSNDRTGTTRWLNRVGLSTFVDVLVCGEDVALGKPSPEPYLLAIERANSSAEHSIAVEDSAQGAEAALKAGLRTYGLCVDTALTDDWPRGVKPILRLDDILPELAEGAHV